MSKTYAVILRHMMDDVPLFVTADKEEAFRYAERPCQQLIAASDAAAEVMGLDATTPVCVNVFTFTDGVLTAAYRPVQHTAEQWEAAYDILKGETT